MRISSCFGKEREMKREGGEEIEAMKVRDGNCTDM
jgi:hypothetical protein